MNLVHKCLHKNKWCGKIVVHNVKIIMFKGKDSGGQSKYQSDSIFITVKISLLRNGLCDVKKVNIRGFVLRNENCGCTKRNQVLANKISVWQSIVEIIMKKKKESWRLKQLYFDNVKWILNRELEWGI